MIKDRGNITVFQGRCPHQDTLLSEGSIENGVLVCRGHGWRFDCASGCKVDQASINLKQFSSFVDDGHVMVDRAEILAWSTLRAHESTSTPSPSPQVRSLSQLPGPKAIPFLGNTLQLDAKKMHLIMEQWCRKFGPIYTYKIMNRPVVVVADAALVNHILHERPEIYRRWSAIDIVMKEMGVNGVFNAEGESWRRQRQLVAQALDPKHLRAFFPTLTNVTYRLLKRWDKASQEQRSVDIQKDLMRYTVDATTNLAFGYDMNTLEQEGDIIQRHLEQIFPMINRRIIAPFPYWHYFKLPADRSVDRAFDAVRAIIREFITDSRARLTQSPKLSLHPTNLLEALLAARDEGHAPLTDDEVLGNIFTILLAGEDTTANSIAWMAHFMCLHPDIQSRMQEEVDSVLGNASLLEDINNADKLAYVEAVMNETMRLKPVGPILTVEPNEDVEVGGIHVPKGTAMALLTRYNCLLESSFTAADEFEPDRWLIGEKPSARHRAGFLPFGSGPRLCPGRSLALLEIKSVISMMCRNFRITETANAGPVHEILAFSMMPGNLRVNFSARR